MTFAWPLALASLALVPLALGAYLLLQRRRMRYAVRFTNLDLLANVVDERPRWRRHVPPALFALALVLLLVGVARPQVVMRSPDEQAAVVLAMDVSGSMEATDVEPSRLVAAKRAAGTFLDRVPDRLKVGLVTFSDGANVLVAPTDDREAVRAAVGSLQAGGATAIGDAIAASARLGSQGGTTFAAERSGEDAPLVVLLLSDGEPSPDTLDPLQAAEEANGRGVRIYTVALGTDEGTVTLTDQFGNEEVVPVPPDRETLSRIAEISGGRFFDAPSEEALEQVYAELGSDVGSKEDKTDVTWAFAGAGALLLLAGGLLSAFWFNRLP